MLLFLGKWIKRGLWCWLGTVVAEKWDFPIAGGRSSASGLAVGVDRMVLKSDSLKLVVAVNSGAPFGNVVSFSDGLPGKGAGIPYFYLTALDPTAAYALKDQRSSLTISEHPIGTCGETDPENPTCAKITLIGKLKLIDQSSTEAKFARSALFAKHIEMKDWPKNHNFQIFKLEITHIFLINWFGGPKPLTVDQYLHWKMPKLAFSL